MVTFEGKTAIVTGGGSGIGKALSKGLTLRGAKVWLVDINEKEVNNVASELGSQAYPVVLDVRDASGIQDLVNEIVAAHGSIDFIFNNAGIGAGGDMHEFGAELFDRVIDINIRGVMNGIAAVYPIMVKQGHGCIVNTASMAGLLPAPLLVPYAMTKHAVVGLSRSLRIEAVRYGVQVNVLCPAAIDTPLIDSNRSEDLGISKKYNARKYLGAMSKPYPAEQFAKEVLDKVKRNKEVIIAPAKARLASFLFRMSPSLVIKVLRIGYLKILRKTV